jgi:PLATZ transcription factor
MYHDVVLLREASAWFDVTHIQPYLNNGHRVLYLDRSLQPKSRLAPNAASCKVCDRTLQHPYLFCSLRCKLRPNPLAGDDENEEVAAETCPNTPQSSVGSAAPSSPGRLVLPPASSKRSPLSHGELTRLLPCGEALPTIVPQRKIVVGGAPKKSTASSPKPVVCVQPTTRKEQPSTPPASPLCDLASDIRKSRRKGHPMHSPVAGPKTFMLLRHTLQPLLL